MPNPPVTQQQSHSDYIRPALRSHAGGSKGYMPRVISVLAIPTASPPSLYRRCRS